MADVFRFAWLCWLAMVSSACGRVHFQGVDGAPAGDADSSVARDSSAAGDSSAPGDCSERAAIGRVLAPEPSAGAVPAKGAEYVDPSFGTCLRRVTDVATEPPSMAMGLLPREPYNADRSLLLALSGLRDWHTYEVGSWSARTDVPVFSLTAAPVWHPTDPDVIRLQSVTTTPFVLREHSVTSGSATVYRDMTAAVQGRFPLARRLVPSLVDGGQPSYDQRLWTFVVEGSTGTLGAVVYDAQANRVVGSLASGTVERVSMSASGRTVVVFDCATATTAYDADFSNPRVLHAGCTESFRWDLGRLANGDDAYLYSFFGAPTLNAVDLDTGETTVVLDDLASPPQTTSVMHLSARAADRAGWALLAFSGCRVDDSQLCPRAHAWFQDKIVAVELVANGRIVNLAWHHHLPDTGLPASVLPSDDFTRALFATNWGRASSLAGEVYEIDLPPLP